MMESSNKFWEDLRYKHGPILIVVLFTFMVQILAVLGNSDADITWSLFGNMYSWVVVGIMMAWAMASLLIPAKEFKGPSTESGFIPVYRANGLQYFGVTLVTFVLLLFIRPQTALEITSNFPQILATCNITAFVFCLFLLFKGKETSDSQGEKLGDLPIMYQFYRGMEVHPVLFGVDVKQLTNCRFGLMAWSLLVVTFTVACWLKHGFNMASLVCAMLQTIYLAKFYWWETGYFNTLDITLDRAGYYICWGCLVWVPAFYTFAAYYSVSHPPLVDANVAWLIFFLGVILTWMNYWVDLQKEYFRKQDGKCLIWNKQAKFIKASYKTNKGIKHSKLLVSGFWGLARHLNYVFEIGVALSWSLPSTGYGIWPFLYPIFLTILLIHRIFRDEEKCAVKYGDAWKEYCQKVPYRMIPGIF